MVEFNIKILTLGDSDVGKSSIIKRIISNKFNDNIKSTIGIDFSCKTIKFGQNYLKIFIWDTAGQERYKTIISSYFNGAKGVLLCFDISNRKSFERLNFWINELKEKLNLDELFMILIGNKIDKENERQISIEESKKFAKEKNIPYFEISAKTNEGIKEMFDYVTTQCKQIVNEENFNIFTSAILFKNDFNIKFNNEKKKCC